jgi:hypothetical protein
MKTLTMLSVVVLFVSGCGKATPTYRLVIVNKKAHEWKIINLPVDSDAKLIQDDVVKNVKPLWDGLVYGESAAFYCERVAAWAVGESISESLEKKGMTATSTTGTAHWRFFKRRDGTAGIEDIDEGRWQTAVSCSRTDWDTIESCFRGTSCLSLERIRDCIQLRRNQVNRRVTTEAH